MRASTGRPAEANEIIINLDPTRQTDAISQELILRSGEHRVDPVMADGLAMRVDIGAVLGPGSGDEIVAALGIPLIPGCDVVNYGFVDASH